MKKIQIYHFLMVLLFMLNSCSKSFLDLKPSKSQVVPETADDLWAIMNNTIKMNSYYPSIGEMASDNCYYASGIWTGLTDLDSKNAYIWSKDIFVEGQANDWSYMYVVVFNANIVLETLGDNKANFGKEEYDNLMGTALFFRSYAFFQLAQHFMEAYEGKNAANKLGIVLRLSSDLNIRSVRSNMQETYGQIISDMEKAAALLPQNATVKSLPSKAAAFMVLSKVYLGMGDYKKALENGNATLESTSSELIDFNKLSTTSSTPFSRFNEETIFYNLIPVGNKIRIDTALLAMYDADDLRKDIYFKKEKDGLFSFKGSYDGSVNIFGGLALDELYLTVAECYARLSDLYNARKTLKMLLDKRYKFPFEFPNGSMDQKALLKNILDHRRKELILRGTRWPDLKRLNKESEFKKTLYRSIEGKQYVLEPNSARYVFPIPLQVITLSGIEQNE